MLVVAVNIKCACERGQSSAIAKGAGQQLVSSQRTWLLGFQRALVFGCIVGSCSKQCEQWW